MHAVIHTWELSYGVSPTEAHKGETKKKNVKQSTNGQEVETNLSVLHQNEKQVKTKSLGAKARGDVGKRPMLELS